MGMLWWWTLGDESELIKGNKWDRRGENQVFLIIREIQNEHHQDFQQYVVVFVNFFHEVATLM